MEPIRIQVDRVPGHGYLAFGLDANLNASGDTVEEAIENLRDIIAGTRKLLNRHPLEKLGPAMLILLAYLDSHTDTLVTTAIRVAVDTSELVEE